MSLDGIVTKSIVYELNNEILDGRIEKVYQPEEDEILLNIRSNGKSYKLLMSASSNNPRMYLTSYAKLNPTSPPMFCMLLRKHLQGSRITGISQASMDRIIHIDIEGYDELGVLSTKTLTIEIMGRHSNIILSEKHSGKIMDSIKRITLDISRVRQVMPGIIYSLPPSQNKLNPLLINTENLNHEIKNANEGIPVFKFIYTTYLGLSPLIAKEVCHRAKVNESTTLGELSSKETNDIINAFCELINDINDNKYNPTLIIDEDRCKVQAFSVINITQYDDLTKTHFDTISLVLENYFLTRDRLDRINQKSTNLRKLISTKLDRAVNKLAKQSQELLNAKEREKYKIFGDLITANIYRIEKGIEEIELENFYSEDQSTIKIQLRKGLSPSQNAQKYYKRYNKLKSAYSFVTKEIAKTKKEIDYLEHILVNFDNCNTVEEMEEIHEELIDEGYVKKLSKGKVKKKKKIESNPRHYISSEGYDMYVGKNNKQNDYLTLKLSSKEDIWLHTKDIPGSHVIIKNKGEGMPPDKTLEEAAMLAAYYSKSKTSSKVPVDYAERRNVRKPNGAKPGMVIYDNNYTMYVTPKESEVAKIEKIED